MVVWAFYAHKIFYILYEGGTGTLFCLLENRSYMRSLRSGYRSRLKGASVERGQRALFDTAHHKVLTL